MPIQNPAMRLLSSRWVQFTLLPIAVLAWFVFTDPSHGADTLLRIQLWSQALLVTGVSYLISKAMLGNASSEELYRAIDRYNSMPAAIAYLGICLLRVGVLIGLLMFFAQVQR